LREANHRVNLQSCPGGMADIPAKTRPSRSNGPIERRDRRSKKLTEAQFPFKGEAEFEQHAVFSITAVTLSVWPDVVVGVGIGLLNLDAAGEVWDAAREEHETASGDTG
jgi:hypothetical protein